MDFLVVVVVIVLFVLGLLVVIDGFSDRGRTPTGPDRRAKLAVGHWAIRDPFRPQDSAGSRHASQIAVGVALMLLAIVIAIVAI